jgi:hypothetical protein
MRLRSEGNGVNLLHERLHLAHPQRVSDRERFIGVLDAMRVRLKPDTTYKNESRV